MPCGEWRASARDCVSVSVTVLLTTKAWPQRSARRVPRAVMLADDGRVDPLQYAQERLQAARDPLQSALERLQAARGRRRSTRWPSRVGR